MIGLSQDSPTPTGANPPGASPTPPPAPKPDKPSFPPMQQDGTPPPKPEDEKIKEELKELGIKKPKTPEVKEPPKTPSPDQPAEKTKTKKSKVVLAVLALLFMVASIPAAVYLVKQRQEIRKEATECVYGSCVDFVEKTGSLRHCRTSEPDKCTVFECDTERDCWIKKEHCGPECDSQSVCHEECDVISEGEGGTGCNANLGYDNCDNLCDYSNASSINGLCDCCCVSNNPCVYQKNPTTGACEQTYTPGKEWFCGTGTTGGVSFSCLSGYYADGNCTTTSGSKPCNCGTSNCNSDKPWCGGATVTPQPEFVCVELSSTEEKEGGITLRCAGAGIGGAAIDHFDFQYRRTGESWIDLGQQTDMAISKMLGMSHKIGSLTIKPDTITAGDWEARCRTCIDPAGNQCSPWHEP